MERQTFTEDELIQALINALDFGDEDNDGFMRVAEMVEQTGHSEGWIRNKLRQLQKDGRLEHGKVYMVDLSGKRTRVNAYRLKRE